MPPFQYCLNTSTIQPTSLPDKIRIAAEAGYAAIELWHVDVDEYCGQGHALSDVKKMLDDAGLTLPSMISLKGWFDSEGEEHATALDDCRRKMAQAAELGCPVCVAGPTLKTADVQQGTRHYLELLLLGREIGVRPALEFLGFAEEFKTLEIALEVMHGTAHDDACLVIDSFHLFRGGSGIEAFAQSGLRADQIGIMHFNDAPTSPPRDEQHDKDRVMPGDGHLDLRRYLEIGQRLGYHGALSLELFNPKLWEADPLEVAKRGLERMQDFAEG